MGKIVQKSKQNGQKRRAYLHEKSIDFLRSMLKINALLSVGVAGFELATPCSQSRCANRTALHPEN